MFYPTIDRFGIKRAHTHKTIGRTTSFNMAANTSFWNSYFCHSDFYCLMKVIINVISWHWRGVWLYPCTSFHEKAQISGVNLLFPQQDSVHLLWIGENINKQSVQLFFPFYYLFTFMFVLRLITLFFFFILWIFFSNLLTFNIMDKIWYISWTSFQIYWLTLTHLDTWWQ